MYEQTKLDEAKYFYSQMSANYGDRQKFNYNLSALLSSARSVLQYSLDEAEKKKGGKAWYDTCVNRSRTLSFFKNKRDINIHDEPIKPSMNVSFSATVKMGIRVSASVTVRDSKGNNKYHSSDGEPEVKTKLQPDKKFPDTTFRYLFSDWKGTEDLMTLCQTYLDELQSVVNDGISKGFLTEK